MSDYKVTIRVWGDYACFTRPEMKVERVSYPVMTPSSARGILEAIFWEPQMYYLIDTVHIIKRGRWFSFRRNEVNSVISLTGARQWMNAPEKASPIWAGGGAPDGTQRNMLALQDVEYLITAEVRLTELGLRGRHPLAVYLDEVRRRARSGKCFHRPALGVREFAADFEYEEDAQAAFDRRQRELGVDRSPYSEDLGLMLYDVFSTGDRVKGFQWLPDELTAMSRAGGKGRRATPRYEGLQARPQAIFFHATVREAKLDCHPDRVRFASHNHH